MLIERNLFYDGYDAIVDCGANWGGTDGEPLIIRNNVFHGWNKAIFITSQYETFIVNNTFADIGEQSIRMEPKRPWHTELVPVPTVANNLFITIPQMAYALRWSTVADVIAAGALWDYNLFFNSTVAVIGDAPPAAFYSLADWQRATGKDMNSLEIDPELISVIEDGTLSNSDYQPGWRSPVIDAGTMTGIPHGSLDFFGNPRVQGMHIDIGACESDLPASSSLSTFKLPFFAEKPLNGREAGGNARFPE